MKNFVIFLVLIFGAPAQAQTQNPGALVQDAINKQKAGDLEGAVSEYQVFLKEHPEVGPVHANLGAALAGLGRYEEAIKEYKIALKLAPSTPGISINLALAYYKMGDMEEASVLLTKAHKAQPNNYQATLLLGDCYLRMGRNKETIELLQPLAKDKPDDLAVAYMLGNAYIRDNQPEEGSVLIDRILRNGDSAEAHLLMGMVKFQALEYPAAIADLTKAAEMNPDLPDLYSYLGQAQMESGDTAAARASFEKELAHNANDFQSNLRLAIILKQDGEYEKATQLLNRALSVRPRDPGALYQVAAIYIATGDLAHAAGVLEQLVKQSPQFLEAHVSLAQVYYRQKRKEDGYREKAVVTKLKAEQDAEQSKSKGEAQAPAAPPPSQ